MKYQKDITDNDLQNATIKIEDLEKYEENLLDFKLYMTRKYSTLQSSEVTLFIRMNIKRLKEYFYSIERILFNLNVPTETKHIPSNKKRKYKKINHNIRIFYGEKMGYMYDRSHCDEIIDLHKAIEKELFNYKVGWIAGFDVDMTYPKSFTTENIFNSKEEYKKFETYHITTYKTILNSIFKTELSNPLIRDLEFTNPKLYLMINKALKENIISLSNNKLYFPFSQNTVSTFFKENKGDRNINWKPIIENILIIGGSKPTSSIKSAPSAPETSEYKDFISRISNL